MVISAETASRPLDPATRSPVAASTTEVTGGTFSLPALKTWGNRRAFQLATTNSKGGGVIGGGYGLGNAEDVPVEAGGGIDRPAGNGTKEDAEIREVREKLLVHLREATDGMKLMGPPPPPPPKDADGNENAEKPEPTTEADPSPSAARPWNLRTRRRSGTGVPSAGKDRYLRSSSPEKRTVRPRFSITLTREEIDEDIYAVTGHRARRRPRKRPRAVQKQVDPLLPGSWLSEISVDSYRVPE